VLFRSMPADGGESRLLTKLPLGAGVPAWSPDASRIAFSAKTGTPPDPDPKKAKPYRRISSMKYRVNGQGFTYDQRRHLFAVDLTGGEPRQVTEGDWDDTQPAWSPDGARLTFISARHDEREFDTQSDAWSVALDGSDIRQLTPTQGACSAPSWSPDGRWIAHTNHPTWPSNERLRLAAADGSELRDASGGLDRQMGAGSLPGAVARPAWLPGGEVLTLAQDRGSTNLWAGGGASGGRWVARTDGMAGWYSVDAAGKTAAVVATEQTRPAELFAVDLATGERSQLTHFNAAWSAEVSLQHAERFTVATEPGSRSIAG